MVNSPYYDKWDNPYWEYHLPVNPAIRPGVDIDIQGNLYTYDYPFNSIDITNWDEPYFLPRLRDGIQVNRGRMREATDDEAPEID